MKGFDAISSAQRDEEPVCGGGSLNKAATRFSRPRIAQVGVRIFAASCPLKERSQHEAGCSPPPLRHTHEIVYPCAGSLGNSQQHRMVHKGSFSVIANSGKGFKADLISTHTQNPPGARL